jgi:hypothetical protein
VELVQRPAAEPLGGEEPLHHRPISLLGSR